MGRRRHTRATPVRPRARAGRGLACDYMLFGPPIAAERRRCATALLVHNIYIVPERGKPAAGPGFLPARGPLGRARDGIVNRVLIALFDRRLQAVNVARREHDLPPLGSAMEHFDRVQRVLVLTSGAFDFHGDSHPGAPSLRRIDARRSPVGRGLARTWAAGRRPSARGRQPEFHLYGASARPPANHRRISVSWRRACSSRRARQSRPLAPRGGEHVGSPARRTRRCSRRRRRL